MSTQVLRLPMRAVTAGPNHHFFGYYDKRQWDPSGRFLLGMRVGFADRPPQPDDRIEIGMVDLAESDRWIPLSSTRAWCWQQGCMLQWLPGSNSSILYNDRIGDRFVSVVLDVHTGERRTLPRAIYAASDDARHAVSLNFSRLATTRPGYGYAGLQDHWDDDPHPTEDGIYRMELRTGNHELVVDIGSLAQHDPLRSMDGAKHWVNHLLINPAGERFIFLHRWSATPGRFNTRFYTASVDGTERRVAPIDRASHFIWADSERILVWATTAELGSHYYLYNDATGEIAPFGEGTLTRDGHITLSPCGRWALTDEYPNKEGLRPLILYRLADGERFDIAHLKSPPEVWGEIRCDLHPRWSPDGRSVCIDSVHEGMRQMYVVDVSQLVGGG